MSLWTGENRAFSFQVLEALMKQGNKVIEMIKDAYVSKKCTFLATFLWAPLKL